MLSNANLVQWSDNSYSIAIGSEIYDLNIHPVGNEEHLHIFAQHQAALLMEDVGTITEKMYLRSISASSSSSSSSLTSRMARAHSEAKVKMAFMPQDPEAARVELEKVISGLFLMSGCLGKTQASPETGGGTKEIRAAATEKRDINISYSTSYKRLA